MDDLNLICDQPGCGNFSTVFGLKGSVKEKRCEEHILDLTRKEMTIYSISAYKFIENSDDVPIYEARRKRVTAGAGNLEIVSSFYEAEVRTAMNGLEKAKGNTLRLVEEYYEDLAREVMEKFDDARRQLERMKQNFEEYLMSKCVDLGENEESLCRNLKDVAGFLRKLLNVGEAVKTKTQLKRCQIDWRLIKSLRFSPLDKDVKSASSVYLEESVGERSQFRYEKSLKLLNKGWSLLHRRRIEERETVLLGLLLGEVLSLHFAQYTEAEEVLTRCLSIEERTDASSGDCMRLRNLLAAIYYYSTKYEEAENTASQVIHNSAANGSAYWTAVYYLCSCHWVQGKSSQSLLTQYISKSIPCPTAEAQMMKLCASALLNRMNGHQQEAEDLHWEAQSVATKSFPLCIYAVDNCYQLGSLYDDMGRREEAMQKYSDAQSVYMTHFPTVIQSACSLYALAVIYANTGRLKEAEVKFLEAHSIFSTYYSKTIQRAANLRDLATLYTTLARFDEADCIFQEAEAIYSTYFPLSHSAAINYNNIAKLYQKLKRTNEAIERATKGKHIFKAHFPKSPQFAHNMLILANFYFELGNLSDAEKMYRKSLKLFKKVDAMSFNCANACHCFGLYCREKGRKVEAERSFSDAYDIYNKHYPGSLEGAQNMLSMGMLYQDMGRRDASISFVSGALECWRRCGIEKPDVEALLLKMRSEPR